MPPAPHRSCSGLRFAFAFLAWAALTTPAFAQVNCANFQGTLQTLRDSYSSNAPLRTLAHNIIRNDSNQVDEQINLSDSNNNNPERDYFGQIRQGLGFPFSGNSVPNAAVFNLLDTVVNGNITNQQSVLNDLSPNFTIRRIIPGPFGSTTVLQDATTRLNYMIAGSGRIALRTMILFINEQRQYADADPTDPEFGPGNGATRVMERLFNGYAYVVLETLLSVLGDGDASAFEFPQDYDSAVAKLNLAINGDADVLQDLQFIVDAVNNGTVNVNTIGTPGACWITNASPLIAANPPPPGGNPTFPPQPTLPPSYPQPGNVLPPFGGQDPPPGPTTKCTPNGADLTGSFGMSPCEWSRDMVPVDSAQDHQGGWYLMKYVEDWWNGEMLPSMQQMTAQIYAGTVDQTRQLGSMMDMQAASSTAALIQQKEYEATKNAIPSDQTCVAATPINAMSRNTKVASALTQGFRNDVTARSAGAPGSTAERGSAADQKARIDTYCAHFYDPKVNAGNAPCPTSATPVPQPNADVDVENFLLKDTIDLRDPAQSAAANAILTNIVQPRVDDRLHPSVVDTPQGQEWILQKEHIKSIRNIATDVVASIISRRAAIPNGSTGQEVRAIREKIGIDPIRISNDPSYHEIMQAMTRERFFDPSYYATMAGSLGSVRQEQTMVNAYIVLQMQDVYKLQEQINALLAARAAMKLNADPLPNRIEAGRTR